MTLCQTLTLDFEDEVTNTRKMLERVPLDDGHRDYRPHAKSMTLSQLATHVAELPGWAKMALETELFELPQDFKPHTFSTSADMMAAFEKGVNEGRAALAAATDEDMQKNWTFKYGDFTMTEPRPKVIRSFLNHLVHHRAQLGVYLRLNEIPVPGMYGPSADESFS